MSHCKVQSSFSKRNKLTNHFRVPLPLVWRGPRVTHYEVVSFDLRGGVCETEWMDYLKWWAGVCSWPPPLRWCPQPPPRGTALPSAARRPPLNGWLHPQTYWHENGFRWPGTRSDKDGHARQNSFSGGTLHYQNRLHLQQHQCAILPYTPGWYRSVGQREEGPMIHWWRCCFDSLLSTLSLAGVVLQVLVGGREKTLRHDLRLWSNFSRKMCFWSWNVFRSSTPCIHAARDVPRQARQMAAAALHLNIISSWLFV